MNDTQRIIEHIKDLERRIRRDIAAMRATQFQQLNILRELQDDEHFATSLNLTIGKPEPQKD